MDNNERTMEEMIEILPTELSQIVFEFLTPQDIVVYDNTSIFKYSILSRNREDLLIEAAKISSNKIIKQMIPLHCDNTLILRKLVIILITENNDEILNLLNFMNINPYQDYHLKIAVKFDRYHIFRKILPSIDFKDISKMNNFIFDLCTDCITNEFIMKEKEHCEFFRYLVDLLGRVSLIDVHCKFNFLSYQSKLKRLFEHCKYCDEPENIKYIINLSDERSLNINKILKNENLSEKQVMILLKLLHKTRKGCGTNKSLFIAYRRFSLKVFEYIHINFMCNFDLDQFKHILKDELETNDDELFNIINYLINHRVCIGNLDYLKGYCSERTLSLIVSQINNFTASERVTTLCGLIEDEKMVKHFKRFSNVNMIMSWCIGQGRLDIVKFAHEQYIPISISLLRTACLYKNLDIIKWLHKNRVDNFFSDIYLRPKDPNYSDIETYFRNYCC